MKKAAFIPLILALILGGILVMGMNMNSVPSSSYLQGKPVPSFQLSHLDNQAKLITEASLTGEIQLLNVWASWCSNCQAEHEFLKTLAKQTGLNIVGLNYRDERNAALSQLKRLGNPYHAVIFDPKGSLALDLGVYGTPETYLIDEKGIIQHRYVGVINAEVWQQQFVPQLAELQREL